MSAIEVKQVGHESLQVGKKILFKDLNGNWIATTELTNREKEALNNYLSQHETEKI